MASVKYKRPGQLNLSVVASPASMGSFRVPSSGSQSARPHSSGATSTYRPSSYRRPDTDRPRTAADAAPFDPFVDGDPFGEDRLSTPPAFLSAFDGIFPAPAGPPPGTPTAPPRRSWPAGGRPRTSSTPSSLNASAAASSSQYPAWAVPTAPPVPPPMPRPAGRPQTAPEGPGAYRPRPARAGEAGEELEQLRAEAASWGRERRRLERQVRAARGEADELRKANELLASRLQFFQRKFEDTRRALDEREAHERLREETRRSHYGRDDGGDEGSRAAPEAPAASGPAAPAAGPPPSIALPSAKPGEGAPGTPAGAGTPSGGPRRGSLTGAGPGAGRGAGGKLRAVAAGVHGFLQGRAPPAMTPAPSAASLVASEEAAKGGGRIFNEEEATEMLVEGPAARQREAAAGGAPGSFLCRLSLGTFTRFQKLLELLRAVAAQDDAELLVSELERAAADLTRAEHAALFVPCEDGAYLQATSAGGPEGAIRVPLDGDRVGCIGRAAREREAVIANDPLGESPHYAPELDGWPGHTTLAVMCFPVLDRRGGLRGVMRVANKASGGRFGRADELLAGVLAQQAALAWEWIEREADLSSCKERLKEVADFAIGMAVTKDRTGFVDTVAEHARGALDADRCSVFLPDRRTEMLYARSPDVAHGFIGVPMSAGIAGHVFSTGREVNILDAWHDKRFRSENDELTGYQTRSVLCYPVRSSDETVLAVLQALNRVRGPPCFTDNDAEILAVYASILGVLLEHSDLYQRLRGRRPGEECEENIRENVKRLERLLSDFETGAAAAPPGPPHRR